VLKYKRLGMYWDEIGELLERSELAVEQRARKLGYLSGRLWTAAEIARAVELKGQRTARQIAGELGRGYTSVHQLFARLGLTKRRPTRGPERERYIRARHAEQWSDKEIADGWTAAHPGDPLDRRYAHELRNRYGLATWGMQSERCRQRVAARTKEQLRRAGLPSLAALRVKAFVDWAASMGWPGITRPRLVQILNLLYERGPHSRKQIAEALGLRVQFNGKNPNSRKWCTGNGPGGTYTATLMRMGLVVRLPGRVVDGCHLYCLTDRPAERRDAMSAVLGAGAVFSGRKQRALCCEVQDPGLHQRN
jgi:hypothetical protein